MCVDFKKEEIYLLYLLEFFAQYNKTEIMKNLKNCNTHI